ncbi:MAG: hypothetical protein MK098_15515, partial [Marinovum sp.]|nr:hypothetical protein [Marinovum sp.]
NWKEDVKMSRIYKISMTDLNGPVSFGGGGGGGGGGVALKQSGLPFWAGLIWASVIGGIAYVLFRAKA